MSFAALAWAAKQKPGNLAAKMVLFGLANFADEHGCAYPSTAALAEFGDMDHKTATAALDRLIALGLIGDTGQRAGRTKQIKIYQLSLQSHPKAEGSQERKASVFSGKDPQKRGTDTVRDTGSEAKASSPRAKKPSDFILPSDIPAEPWAGWEQMRKGIGFPPSDHARTLAVNALRKLRDEDGWPPGDVLNHCTLNSYRGIFPPKDRQHGRQQHHPHLGKTSAALIELGGVRDERPM